MVRPRDFRALVLPPAPFTARHERSVERTEAVPRRLEPGQGTVGSLASELQTDELRILVHRRRAEILVERRSPHSRTGVRPARANRIAQRDTLGRDVVVEEQRILADLPEKRIRDLPGLKRRDATDQRNLPAAVSQLRVGEIDVDVVGVEVRTAATERAVGAPQVALAGRDAHDCRGVVVDRCRDADPRPIAAAVAIFEVRHLVGVKPEALVARTQITGERDARRPRSGLLLLVLSVFRNQSFVFGLVEIAAFVQHVENLVDDGLVAGFGPRRTGGPETDPKREHERCRSGDPLHRFPPRPAVGPMSVSFQQQESDGKRCFVTF